MRVEEFISITVSSRKTDKQRRIHELIEKLDPYDTLIVAELTRLGRSTS
jgi:DNA invertase Pin-like site-specific DNA recombinase